MSTVGIVLAVLGATSLAAFCLSTAVVSIRSGHLAIAHMSPESARAVKDWSIIVSGLAAFAFVIFLIVVLVTGVFETPTTVLRPPNTSRDANVRATAPTFQVPRTTPTRQPPPTTGTPFKVPYPAPPSQVPPT